MEEKLMKISNCSRLQPLKMCASFTQRFTEMILASSTDNFFALRKDANIADQLMKFPHSKIRFKNEKPIRYQAPQLGEVLYRLETLKQVAPARSADGLSPRPEDPPKPAAHPDKDPKAKVAPKKDPSFPKKAPSKGSLPPRKVSGELAADFASPRERSKTGPEKIQREKSHSPDRSGKAKLKKSRTKNSGGKRESKEKIATVIRDAELKPAKKTRSVSKLNQPDLGDLKVLVHDLPTIDAEPEKNIKKPREKSKSSPEKESPVDLGALVKELKFDNFKASESSYSQSDDEGETFNFGLELDQVSLIQQQLHFLAEQDFDEGDLHSVADTNKRTGQHFEDPTEDLKFGSDSIAMALDGLRGLENLSSDDGYTSSDYTSEG